MVEYYWDLPILMHKCICNYWKDNRNSNPTNNNERLQKVVNAVRRRIYLVYIAIVSKTVLNTVMIVAGR